MKLEEHILNLITIDTLACKFQELINKNNKRDTFRLMIFIKFVMKDYDSTM